MSTGYIPKKDNNHHTSSRFAKIAKLGDVVFHTGDLANLWNIRNKNTLYTTIKRYVGQGLLFRVYKGFYAIKPPQEIDAFLLGIKAIHGYAYVSTETILCKEGIIQQVLPAITLMSGVSRRFAIAGHQYHARKLADRFLYQSIGIVENEFGVRTALPERAIADLLYVNTHAFFDGDRMIDWAAVRTVQRTMGYPLTPKRYG
jgi:predicted transcriptional regulator of viral defense system